MYTGIQYGRMAYSKPPKEREEFKDIQVTKKVSNVNARREYLTLQLKQCLQKEKEIQADIVKRGNISEAANRQSLRRGIIQCLFLIICLLGEFIFAHWTIAPFGLEPWEAFIVAGAIVILSMEAIDLYLTSLRRLYPNIENHFFLALGCMGFLAIIVLIYFLADIRGGIYHTTSVLSSTDSLEETVRSAREFSEANAMLFVWLMMTLTSAFVIVGGVIYHDVKHRIPFSLSYSRIYRERKNIQDEMNEISKELSFLDSEVPQFIADFEAGLAEEHLRKDAEKHQQVESVQTPAFESKKTRKTTGYIVPFLINPVTLALFAFLILFLWRGKANGEERIIFLDMSKSVGVSDYSGQKTEFQKNVKAIEEFIRNHVAAGDKLKVIAVTEISFSRPHVLLDAQISKNKGSFGEGLAKEKLRLLKEWKKLDLKPTAKATDIFGAVNLSAIYFSPNSDNKSLLFYSDMRQCAYEFNLERPMRINAENILAEVEQKGLIPQLEGVKVHCLGVHSAGKTPAYWLDLKKFWTLYFNRAKSKLLTFSMERRIQK